MIKREIFIISTLIITVFFIGFFLRLVDPLSSVPDNEKAYYQDENGIPYMYEIDSYYNYRLTQNLVDHGYIGDTIVNGRQWDTHSYYPPGVPMDYPPLLPYLSAFFYYIVNIFGDVPLIVTCFWLPILIGPLAGVVTYLFLRRFTNEYGAITAGILISLAPYYFTRTVPGWYDTDMFNIIFPILTFWFFLEAVQNIKNLRQSLMFTILSALSMALFSLAWNGWQYLFYIIVIFSLFYFIYCKLQHKQVKNAFLTLGSFILLTVLSVLISSGYLSLINLILSPLEFLSVFMGQNVWAPFPNNYIMISELTKPSLEVVISGIGISFFGGILGFIWVYRILIDKTLKNKFLNNLSWFFYSFLIFWTIIGFISLLSGIRFIILLIPPLVISTGFLVGLVIDYVNEFKLENFDSLKFTSQNKTRNLFQKINFKGLFSILVVVLFVITAVISVNNFQLVPLVNDDVNAAAEWINNSSNITDDTVIITSWTWGHFYTAIADRPVLFDGRVGYIETLSKRDYDDDAYPYKKLSPSSSREYWIDEAFSSSNESLSMGIFRMLATSGDSGYLFLDNYTKNTTKSVEILNNILGVDNQTALSILKTKYGFNNEQAENILNYSHPDHPRPFIIITNKGMINKGYWIFYFGGWDLNKETGNDITYSVGQMNFSDDIFKSNNGVIYNSKIGNVSWNNKTPYSVSIIRNNSTEKVVLNENSDFSIILIMDTNQSILVDKGFEDSLFTKLVMENGYNSSFKPLYKNGNVIIWNVSS